MAVAANTYGLATGVEALVGDLVSGRLFSTSTTPTTAQVESWLDGIAAELHAELSRAGYPIKSNTDLSTDSVSVHAFVRHLNNVGAAAMALDSVPGGEIVAVDGQDGTLTRGQRLWARYKRGLDMIRDGVTIERMGLAKNVTGTARLSVLSYKDADGNVKDPFFSRDMLDYQGSRSLVL